MITSLKNIPSEYTTIPCKTRLRCMTELSMHVVDSHNNESTEYFLCQEQQKEELMDILNTAKVLGIDDVRIEFWYGGKETYRHKDIYNREYFTVSVNLWGAEFTMLHILLPYSCRGCIDENLILEVV